MEARLSFDNFLYPSPKLISNIKISSCKTNNSSAKIEPIIVGTLVNNNRFKFIIDTGASTSVINKPILPENQYIEHASDVTLTTANGSSLCLLGKTCLEF